MPYRHLAQQLTLKACLPVGRAILYYKIQISEMNMMEFMNEPLSDDEVEFLPILPEEDGQDGKKLAIPDILPLLPLRTES